MTDRIERLDLEARLISAKNPYLHIPCDVLVVHVGYKPNGQPNRAWCVVRVKRADGTYGRLRVIRNWTMQESLPIRLACNA